MGIIAVYASLILLFSLPSVQKALANWIADILSEKLETRVEIGSVNLGFLNRVRVSDLTMFDRNGTQMLKVPHVSGSMNYLQIIRGNIHISTAQLFSPTIIIYSDSIGAEPNFQFVIDAFSSDSEEKTPLNVRVNTFILRHANMSYDVKSEPHRQFVDSAQGLYAIDVNHLKLTGVGMNLSLKTLTDDSLNLGIKRLSAKELNSGLEVENMSFNLEANKSEALLTKLSLNSLNSSLSIEKLRLFYSKFQQDGSFRFAPVQLRALIVPSDFQSLLPLLNKVHTPLHLIADVSGGSSNLNIDRLHLSNPLGSIKVDAMSSVGISDGKVENAEAYIKDVHVTADGMKELLQGFGIAESISKPLVALGDVDYTGEMNYYKGSISSVGQLNTTAGNIDYKAQMDTTRILTAHSNVKNFNVGRVMNNNNYGLANLNMDIKTQGSQILSLSGLCDVQSPAINVQSDMKYKYQGGTYDLKLLCDIDNINPQALALMSGHKGDKFSGIVAGHLVGSTVDNVAGKVRLTDLSLQNDSVRIDVDSITIDIERQTNNSHMSVYGDFVKIDVDGDIYLSSLARQVTTMLQPHLNKLITVKPSHDNVTYSNFTYNAVINPHPLLEHYLPSNVSLVTPVESYGFVNTELQQLSMNVKSKKVEYGERQFNNVLVRCNNTAENLSANLSTIVTSDESAARVDLQAVASNSIIDGNVRLQLRGNTNINMDLNSQVSFADSLGSLKTNIDIGKSLLTINDSLWHISPSVISIYKKDIAFNDFQLNGANDSYLRVNGMTSASSDNDSIVARINNLQIGYILDAIDFTVVNIDGMASGTMVLDDVMSDNPLFHANLNVDDLIFESGSMGRATIHGSWNKENEAIMLDAWMVQLPKEGEAVVMPTGTELHGFVSPAKNDLRLDITANRTNADFLNGFLNDIFHPIKGNMTGMVSVIGPLDNVNLVGEVDADLTIALLATSVPYQAVNQHASLRPNSIVFSDVVLTDRFGNEGRVNGTVSHRNLANFKYDFDAKFSHILAYDERTFNENNFYATVFADGDLKVSGSDGHPMYITANITPTRGSTFVYDSASPDAITSGNFIEFNDITPVDTTQTSNDDYMLFNYFGTSDADESRDFVWKRNEQSTDSLDTRYLYHGDLYMDFNVDLNENCQIRLRMDNNADGYITAYGRGFLTAKYHNKGSLELFGTYDIQRGSYRLYMQDLIYKDLIIEEGSSVEFNGEPFGAHIHLLCHHTVNAVPLSDLTATTAYAANNKVKVNCILDITGTLGNMAFKFNIDILNVSDEIKQLARSMINSEEEMNTQIIYLLALGRFYPTTQTLTSTDNASSSAVNSLVSSTLSGQLNNIIGNLIGNNSNWNFGTGIVTGEQGWNDLDVEGSLSGRLFNDRLLINGNFGYRDNTLTNTGTFVGDFEVRWRLGKTHGNTYLKAYNQTNDRYFTKSTLNTQGIGLSYVHDFETWKTIFKK